MPTFDLTEAKQQIQRGVLIPYLGPGALQGVANTATGEPMPADSEALILAMNAGRPMAPRLMHEFPRAAMHLENKRGRKFLERFLTDTYADTQWSVSPVHQCISDLRAPYVVDTNRDLQLQTLYRDRPHVLVVGCSRITASPFRFQVHLWRDGQYRTIDPGELDPRLPVLFKPLGTPLPKASYVASDADFVDYITELMGGFALPPFLKNRRRGVRYLLLGLSLQRDTERMVLSEIIIDCDQPNAGYAAIPSAGAKVKRYCARHGFSLLQQDSASVLGVEIGGSQTNRGNATTNG